jgi:hypothetical protein
VREAHIYGGDGKGSDFAEQNHCRLVIRTGIARSNPRSLFFSRRAAS